MFRQTLGPSHVETTTNHFSYHRDGETYCIETELGPNSGSEITWSTAEGIICLGDYPVAKLSAAGESEQNPPGRNTPLVISAHRSCFPRSSSYAAKVVWYAFARLDELRDCGPEHGLELPWTPPGELGTKGFRLEIDPSAIGAYLEFGFSRKAWLHHAALLHSISRLPEIEDGYRLGWLGKPRGDAATPGADLILARHGMNPAASHELLEVVQIFVSDAAPGRAAESFIPPQQLSKPANVVDFRLATDEQPFLNVRYSITNGWLPSLGSPELKAAFRSASAQYDRKMKALSRTADTMVSTPTYHSRRLILAGCIILSAAALVFIIYKNIKNRRV